MASKPRGIAVEAMPGPYLDVPAFRTCTSIVGEDVDWLETAYPGFLLSKLNQTSRWIDGRLFKRYVVPFGSVGVSDTAVRTDVPDIILGWLCAIVTHEAWKKRGGVPSGDTSVAYVASSDAAKKEVGEAADSAEGLFDLPLKQSQIGQSGVSRGNPLGYSEQSPYAFTDIDHDGHHRGPSR